MDKIELVCANDRVFTDVDFDAIKKAKMIRDVVQYSRDIKEEINRYEFTHIDGDCMEKVIEYCNHHKDHPDPEEAYTFDDKIDEFDLKLLESLKDGQIYDLILVAHKLNVTGLLDVATTFVSRMIACENDMEKIRQKFKIKLDLTEEQIREIMASDSPWPKTDEEDDDEDSDSD